MRLQKCVFILWFFFRRRIKLQTCILIFLVCLQDENEIADMCTNIYNFSSGGE